MQFSPQPLRVEACAVCPDYLFELKYNGFRALAYLEDGRCKLVSRNGTTFASFSILASAVGFSLPNCRAVLDGEIVCLDSNGCPQFNDLLFHRAEPCFMAFDIVSCNGTDLRLSALVERKAELRRLLRSTRGTSRILYARQVERDGCRLFELICQRDLEGIVAKLKHGHYTSDREESTWIKNKNYSQSEGRAEFFNREKPPKSVYAGWESCALVWEDMEMAL